jgi:hypothetical protein
MSEQTARLIALVLLPFGVFALRFISRSIVELLYRIAPEGWFKRLLARDRASRARRS